MTLDYLIASLKQIGDDADAIISKDVENIVVKENCIILHFADGEIRGYAILEDGTIYNYLSGKELKQNG